MIEQTKIEYTKEQKLVEVSCLRCKETVKELVSANPFNVRKMNRPFFSFFSLISHPNCIRQLVEACRRFTLNANPVFSSVYQYIAFLENEDTRSELLLNVLSLEQQLKELVGATKEHAVQAQYGKPEAGVETKKHLEECGEEFLLTMEKLRPSNEGKFYSFWSRG